VEYLILLHGALWAGLVIVPINAKLHEREVDYIVHHAEARLLFVGSDEAFAAVSTERHVVAAWVAAALG
jgi:long-chain acyl-CoA synthetase